VSRIALKGTLPSSDAHYNAAVGFPNSHLFTIGYMSRHCLRFVPNTAQWLLHSACDERIHSVHAKYAIDDRGYISHDLRTSRGSKRFVVWESILFVSKASLFLIVNPK
jgi:hypothetical protein